jgi:hypothetical protein
MDFGHPSDDGRQLGLRVNAYVLAADPAYLAASVQSYYALADRIVVSFDESHKGWSGHPVDVPQSLNELAAIDVHNKLDLRAGRFSDPARPAMEGETKQRQAALEIASEGADWVLQLDGDEVLPDLERFAATVESAHAGGYPALEYPARWLYAKAVDGTWLELSRRWWGVAAGYPGPVAVRAGSRLKLARQIGLPAYRVDFRSVNTDPWRRADEPVHETVDEDQGILHFSWVRSEEELWDKARVSGHSTDFNWAAAIKTWKWRRAHPRIAALGNPVRRQRHLWDRPWVRRTRIPLDPPARVTSD